MAQIVKSFVQTDTDSLSQVLYHYTSFEGLRAILSGGHLRATHSHYLNDASEAKLIHNLLRQSLKAWKPVDREDYSRSRDALLAFMEKPLLTQHFITSFSEADDSLSQWRAYCPHGGVSIGFKPGAIRRAKAIHKDGTKLLGGNVELSKVQYLQADRKSLIQGATHELLEFLSIWDDECESSEVQTLYENTLAQFACRYKDQGFADEREWRLTVSDDVAKGEMEVCFRSTASMLIPFVEVSLCGIAVHPDGSDRGISNIVVGPGPHMEINKAAIELFLTEHDIPSVDVRCSQIPYRHW